MRDLCNLSALSLAALVFWKVAVRKATVLHAVESDRAEIVRMNAVLAWKNYLAALALSKSEPNSLRQAHWRVVARFSLNVHFWRIEHDPYASVQLPAFWADLMSRSEK